jgi:hypothetical protein
MNKSEFIQSYIISRTSHKKPLRDLLKEAEDAYEFSIKAEA